jgi:glycosyltransferase involved in cell wall biosynthesis
MNEPVLWIYLPTAVELTGKLDERFVLYHCIDEFETIAWGRHSVIAAQEQRMLGNADLTVTCSEQVFSSKQPFAKEIINVPNGVDFDHYFTARRKQTLVAPELRALDGATVVGFSGVLDDRLDTELILRAAERYPGFHFVLVGPARKAFPQLQGRNNIHLLGNRPVESLPSYIKGFDVCLVPYVLNEFVRNISPTKLYEYLAAGKPVVAPAIRALDDLEDLVYVGKDSDEMINLIGIAARDDNEETITLRTDLARRNTWQKRVDVISDKVLSMMEQESK